MNHPTLSDPVLRLIGFGLRRTPLKTRLGGVSTVLCKFFNLRRFTDPVMTRLRSGARLRVRLSDYDGRMIFFFGTIDPKVVTTCQSLLRPGDTLLDIGANHGAVGLQCLNQIGADGHVHFVEPQIWLCDVIREALEGQDAAPSTIHQVGLWDEDGEFTLQLEDQHTGAASLAETPLKGDGSGITVKTREIVSFLDEVVGDQPFGAKIDVEGAEIIILPAILRRPGFRFAVFECNRDSVREFVPIAAREHGLRMFGIEKHLFRTRLTPLGEGDDLRRHHDIVVVAGDLGEDITKPVHPKHLLSSK